MRRWRRCAAVSLSSWAANRVMVPLARANSEHAERLLAMLAATPLSTRELQCWFEHYQQTLRTAREHMVNRPRLFIDTLAGEHGEARRRAPACRPRRRMHRRFALPRGGDRAAAQACRHAAPAAGAADRGGTAPAHGDRRPDQRA